MVASFEFELLMLSAQYVVSRCLLTPWMPLPPWMIASPSFPWRNNLCDVHLPFALV